MPRHLPVRGSYRVCRSGFGVHRIGAPSRRGHRGDLVLEGLIYRAPTCYTTSAAAPAARSLAAIARQERVGMSALAEHQVLKEFNNDRPATTPKVRTEGVTHIVPSRPEDKVLVLRLKGLN